MKLIIPKEPGTGPSLMADGGPSVFGGGVEAAQVAARNALPLPPNVSREVRCGAQGRCGARGAPGDGGPTLQTGPSSDRPPSFLGAWGGVDRPAAHLWAWAGRAGHPLPSLPSRGEGGAGGWAVGIMDSNSTRSHGPSPTWCFTYLQYHERKSRR